MVKKKLNKMVGEIIAISYAVQCYLCYRNTFNNTLHKSLRKYLTTQTLGKKLCYLFIYLFICVQEHPLNSYYKDIGLIFHE